MTSELEKKAFWVKVPIIGGNPNLQVVPLVDYQILNEKAQKLEKENKRLKSWVYCQCKKPDYNKFGMDNMCARCRKPIENHPLSLSSEKVTEK